ncbi:hypothetical protein AAF712_012648 [Marasmius tenuissimus]|uniref:Monocarboxylate transporter n=1 Tax=Marasmius tenuissimus TaxID=585030 RepID=A0ABR2ZH69_9AGAR
MDHKQGSILGGDSVANVTTRESPPPPDKGDPVPEGGVKAWFVVVGLACCHFTIHGYINSWGVFRMYYEEEQTHYIGLTPANMRWIGAAQRSLVFFPTVVVRPLFDRGYFEHYFTPASILFVVSLVLTAECTKFWQLLLCQGILSGITAGCLVGNVSAICAQYFKKRSELALALVYGGSTLGGIMYPVVSGVLLPRMGFQWTLRILDWIGFVTLAIASIVSLLEDFVLIEPVSNNLQTVRRRNKNTVKGKTPFFSLKPLRNLAFGLYCLAYALHIIGFFTFATYVSSTAVVRGVTSPEFGYFLIGVLNAVTGLGRIPARWTASKCGSLNVTIPSLAISGTILAGGWTATKNNAGLVMFTIAYGLCAAPFSVLATDSTHLFDVPKNKVDPKDESDPGGTSDTSHVGLRISLLNLFASIGGLVGPLTSGEVNLDVGIRAMAGYAGGCALLASLLLLGTVYMLTDRRLGRELEGNRAAGIRPCDRVNLSPLPTSGR